MALDDALNESIAIGKRLRIDEILDALTVEDRAVLLNALHNPRMSARAIARALTIEGHQIQDGAVHKWRHRNAR